MHCNAWVKSIQLQRRDHASKLPLAILQPLSRSLETVLQTIACATAHQICTNLSIHLAPMTTVAALCQVGPHAQRGVLLWPSR